MVHTVILFSFFLPPELLAQCRERLTRNGSEILRGVVNDPDCYHRNLIVQDLALANQERFEETSVQFEYELVYFVDQCNPDFVEIKAYMYVGSSRQRLQLDNMPSYLQMQTFAQSIADLCDKEIVDESRASRVLLLK